LRKVGVVVTVVETCLPLVEGEGVVVEARPVAESRPVLNISTSGIIVGRL